MKKNLSYVFQFLCVSFAAVLGFVWIYSENKYANVFHYSEFPLELKLITFISLFIFIVSTVCAFIFPRHVYRIEPYINLVLLGLAVLFLLLGISNIGYKLRINLVYIGAILFPFSGMLLFTNLVSLYRNSEHK